MSDQALAWKAGFGALVLLFCAVTSMTRRPVETPLPAARTPVPALQSPAVPLPALPQASDPAPLDVQEDAPPVRVEVTLQEGKPRHVAPPPKVRPAKIPAPRVHKVVAKRKASPYAVGRKHYPMGPYERVAMRDAP